VFNQYTYLYVEDDALSRQVMELIMRKAMGVDQLILFEDSQDFLQRVKACSVRPDVILLDIHIRPHDGFQMLQMLRDDPDLRDKPVVALTASVMNEEIEQLREAGFHSTIAKPVDVHTFPELIERIIEGESVWHIS
jgi:CheY-like chemotaxis protein